MKIGAHVSAAGGLWKAGPNGKKLGCEVIQIFSRPPQGGQPKPITQADAKQFKDSMKENGIKDVYIHAPYLLILLQATIAFITAQFQFCEANLNAGLPSAVKP